MPHPLTRRAPPLLPLLACLLAPGCQTDSGNTLIFAGDTMLGRAVGSTASSHGDWAFPVRRVEARLRAADLAFGNLECVAAKGATTQFSADPRALDGLRDAGLGVISLANNHTADAGLAALAETADRAPVPTRLAARDHRPSRCDHGGISGV